MDPSQVDALVHRLLTNPHDEDALAHAHQAGTTDPKSYALLLERVGVETRDPGYASHWLSEAANVWSTTLGDAHRAARVLMQAIDRDPTQRVAADRLGQLYREKGDVRALVALLERRTKALSGVMPQTAEIRDDLRGMYEELGRLWQDNLQQPKKGQENFRRAQELAQEPADPTEQLNQLRADADAQRAAGDLVAATATLARAREFDAKDVVLQQQYAAAVVDRIAAGEAVPPAERSTASALLAGLAEAFDGEHGLAYSAAALDIDPGHDRALQLYAYYAQSLQRDEDVPLRYLSYISANPSGAMAADARWILAGSYEAAGEADHAIQILEPLRALNDREATAKLRELYDQIGRRMPSESPAAGTETVTNARQLASTHAEGTGGGRRAAQNAQKASAALDAAQAFVQAGKRPDAFKKYREVLEVDPAHPEAFAWVEDYLRTKRDYPSLRDVLVNALRATGESTDTRRDRLRELAGLCEGNLRDIDGAINAWRQLLAIDRGDEPARQSLTRLLERAQRWDDLAGLHEQEANAETDIEKKLTIEKKLATLHEQKRRDPTAAAEAWERIANLTPENDQAILTASKMFEKTNALDRAAQVIAANAPSVVDAAARGSLLDRLGDLYEKLDDPGRAGEAFADAADAMHDAKLYDAAERNFVASERWDRAGQAATAHGELEKDPKAKARHLARGGDYLGRGGDDDGALGNLIQATELDPENEDFAQLLSERYTATARWTDLVELLLQRADRATDRGRRVALRRQAANLYDNELSDKDSARDTWRKILEDGHDEETIEHLIDDALTRADYAEATPLLQRLEAAATTGPAKALVALREAEVYAESIGDVDTAISRYERIATELDPTCRLALQAIADLQQARDKPADAAGALERELKLVTDPSERAGIGNRLAGLYDGLGDTNKTIHALDVVRAADPDDFDALIRLSDLCEKAESWAKLAELLAQRVEIEGDEAEASSLTLKLASVLADKLNRGDEALATLTDLADQGHEAVRDEYVRLGDKLGWGGIVAAKLVDWWLPAKPGPERAQHLRAAFDRFAEVGRDEDAVRIGSELVRSKAADAELATQLEKLATKVRNLDALAAAHDLIAREYSGTERARELVRQAETRAAAGAPAAEAIQHGEAGLTSVPASEAEDLLSRLGALADKPSDVVDLYERQVMRCKSPADKGHALARAAQVAATKGQIERARGFFDIALTGTPSDESVAELEAAARAGDEESGGDGLRRTLCEALEAGGQGARDGGRTRGSLLRRAALMTFRDLAQADPAFTLLGTALVTHVEPATLDVLEALAREVGDLRRADAVLSQVLEEVFDGPLVRQVLARRAKLRRDHLDDKPAAAIDFKKLHELSPQDQAVMTDLIDLLTELGDYRAMVRVYEDQILRGKDMGARAELARTVARMWEERLADPREAADAWRRVLRMKQGDPEATEGLERAKSNMLKSLDPTERKSRPPPPVAPKEDDGEGTAPPPIPPAARLPDVSIAADISPAKEADLDLPPVRDPDKTPPGDIDQLLAETAAEDATQAGASIPTPPPPVAVETPPAPNSDIAIDVDMSADTSGEHAEMSGEHTVVDEDDIVMADEVEVVEESAPAVKTEPPPKPKRSMPPPLPPRS
jgi:tetratricopeptide (TPR) repeat protein